MDQTFVNWMLGGFGALFGVVLKTLWDAVKDLQSSDKEMADKVSKIEVLVAGQYVTRTELEKLATTLFTKLDRIESKIDTKADKE